MTSRGAQERERRALISGARGGAAWLAVSWATQCASNPARQSPSRRITPPPTHSSFPPPPPALPPPIALARSIPPAPAIFLSVHRLLFALPRRRYCSYTHCSVLFDLENDAHPVSASSPHAHAHHTFSPALPPGMTADDVFASLSDARDWSAAARRLHSRVPLRNSSLRHALGHSPSLAPARSNQLQTMNSDPVSLLFSTYLPIVDGAHHFNTIVYDHNHPSDSSDLPSLLAGLTGSESEIPLQSSLFPSPIVSSSPPMPSLHQEMRHLSTETNHFASSSITPENPVLGATLLPCDEQPITSTEATLTERPIPSTGTITPSPLYTVQIIPPYRKRYVPYNVPHQPSSRPRSLQVIGSSAHTMHNDHPRTSRRKRPDYLWPIDDPHAELQALLPHPSFPSFSSRPRAPWVTILRLLILTNPGKKATLAEIYRRLEQCWPYFAQRPQRQAARSSIRNVLSLNTAFHLEPRAVNSDARGGVWTVVEHVQPLMVKRAAFKCKYTGHKADRRLVGSGGRPPTSKSSSSSSSFGSASSFDEIARSAPLPCVPLPSVSLPRATPMPSSASLPSSVASAAPSFPVLGETFCSSPLMSDELVSHLPTDHHQVQHAMPFLFLSTDPLVSSSCTLASPAPSLPPALFNQNSDSSPWSEELGRLDLTEDVQRTISFMSTEFASFSSPTNSWLSD